MPVTGSDVLRPADVRNNGPTWDFDVDLSDELELELFLTQDRLRTNELARREALKCKLDEDRVLFEQMEAKRRRKFQAKQRAEINCFNKEESKLQTELRRKFMLEMRKIGIDKIRTCTIPAYTFTRFAELPLELQFRIWSLASHSHEPRLHPMVHDNDRSDGLVVVITEDIGIPSILHVCQASRTIAQKIYSVWHCDIIYNYGSDEQRQVSRPRYLNTLYDIFYIVGAPDLLRNRILQAMLLPKDLSETSADREIFAAIKHLHVDTGMYAAVPTKLWAQMFQLEKLTAVLHISVSAFYDFEAETDPYDISQYGFDFENMGEVEKESTYGKRQEWVLTQIRKRIEVAKANDPELHFPEVDVIIRVSGCAHDANPHIDEVASDSESADESSTEDEAYDEWSANALAHWVDELPENIAVVHNLERRYIMGGFS